MGLGLRTVAALLLLLPAVPVCRADTIYLKNGRELEATVLEEDSTSIVVALESGSLRLAKDKIDRIEADTPEKAAAREALQKALSTAQAAVPEKAPAKAPAKVAAAPKPAAPAAKPNTKTAGGRTKPSPNTKADVLDQVARTLDNNPGRMDNMLGRHGPRSVGNNNNNGTSPYQPQTLLGSYPVRQGPNGYPNGVPYPNVGPSVMPTR